MRKKEIVPESVTRDRESGVSIVEVGILVALLSVVVLIGTSGLGQGIRTELSDTSAVLGVGDFGGLNTGGGDGDRDGNGDGGSGGSGRGV